MTPNFVYRKTVDFCLQHVIHNWKAYASAVNSSYQETILVHPTRPQVFAGKSDSTFYNILDLLLPAFKYRVLLLTVPSDFQYQNEKQVTANQNYFFKKFSI